MKKKTIWLFISAYILLGIGMFLFFDFVYRDGHSNHVLLSIITVLIIMGFPSARLARRINRERNNRP